MARAEWMDDFEAVGGGGEDWFEEISRAKGPSGARRLRRSAAMSPKREKERAGSARNGMRPAPPSTNRGAVTTRRRSAQHGWRRWRSLTAGRHTARHGQLARAGCGHAARDPGVAVRRAEDERPVAAAEVADVLRTSTPTTRADESCRTSCAESDRFVPRYGSRLVPTSAARSSS